MIIESTSVPCPPWCTLPPGHGYDSLSRDGGIFVRAHAAPRLVPDLELNEEHNTTPMSREVGVDVIAEEQALSDEGAGAVVGAPVVTLTSEFPIMTAAEARRLAEALLVAADQVDELAGGVL